MALVFAFSFVALPALADRISENGASTPWGRAVFASADALEAASSVEADDGADVMSMASLRVVRKQVSSGMIHVPLKQLSESEAPSVPPSFFQLSSLPSGAMGASAAPTVDVFGQIEVGDPPQLFNVALDTGSGNLMLTSSLCRDLGCMPHKPYEAHLSVSSQAVELEPPSAEGEEALIAFPDGQPEEVTIAMATGHADGLTMMDRVCLGQAAAGACVTSGFISMTRMSREPWDTFPFDGVLGLGMPASSMDRRFNFLGNLAEQGILRRNRFAVWLAAEHDQEDSEITFGDFPEHRLGSEILWLPVSNTDTGMWQVHMADAAVNNHLIGVCGLNGCQAAFDTGTSVIAGSSAWVEGVLAGLNIATDCSNYDTLPTLGFAMRMYILNIEKTNYVKRVGEHCYHQFLKVDIPPPKGPLVLLGNPFLRQYFTIFDRDSLKVGVSFATHAPRPGTTETLQQRVERLMFLAV